MNSEIRFCANSKCGRGFVLFDDVDKNETLCFKCRKELKKND